jgi:hypothetical protein
MSYALRSSRPRHVLYPAAVVSYSTSFPLSETPLSEGGVWTNSGLGQTNVVSAAGEAYGTSSAAGGGATADSAAILSGSWPANMSVSTVLKKVSGTVDFQEVEMLFRCAAGSTALRGYECFLEQRGQYLSLVKRLGTNGGVEGVDYIFLVDVFPVTSPNDGDEFKATIQGNVFTAYLAGSLIWTHDITKDKNGTAVSTYNDGSVGIGFDGPGGGGYADSKWGFKSFTASTL